MRQSTVVVGQRVERAALGEWFSKTKNVNVPVSTMIPYSKGREDIEVLLRNKYLLDENQPVELCGVQIGTMLKRAANIREQIQTEALSDPFRVFASEHPLLVSFPSEVIWLGGSSGLGKLKSQLIDSIPKTDLGLTRNDAKVIAEDVYTTALASKGNYGFWTDIITRQYQGEAVSRILLEATIVTAKNVRAAAMSGLVPVIDYRTPNSSVLSHRYNMAYATRLDKDTDINAPMYFYTLEMNSSVFKPDDRSNGAQIEAMARSALESNLFDGIHLRIRGLSRISQDQGKINTVKDFVQNLSSIAEENLLPFWWSNAGMAGFAGLDLGVKLASCRINMTASDDLFIDGGSGEEEAKYGKLLDWSRRRIYDINQVSQAMAHPMGLPEVEGFRNVVTAADTVSPYAYRTQFSKPYNLAALNHLNREWRDQIEHGEVRPGESYLASFTPYAGWSTN